MNYCSVARTNFFTVKNAADFKVFLSKLGVPEFVEDSDNQFCLFFDQGAGVPNSYVETVDGQEKEVEIDFMLEIANHLTPNSIAVFMDVGNEGLRYINGHAIAVNHKGESVELNLCNVYELARSRFGDAVTIDRF